MATFTDEQKVDFAINKLAEARDAFDDVVIYASDLLQNGDAQDRVIDALSHYRVLLSRLRKQIRELKK
jgi:hypothetical protein